MKRTPAYVLAALFAGLGAYSLVRSTSRRREDSRVPDAVLSQPWVKNRLADGAMVFEAPWKLESAPLGFPPEVRAVTTRIDSLGHEAQGIHVGAMYMALKDGQPFDLEAAIQGSVNEVRAVPGTTSVKTTRKPAELGGHSGVELRNVIHREGGKPLTMHSLTILRGSEMFQVLMVYRYDQPNGDRAWDRCRASMTLTGGGSQ